MPCLAISAKQAKRKYNIPQKKIVPTAVLHFRWHVSHNISALHWRLPEGQVNIHCYYARDRRRKFRISESYTQNNEIDGSLVTRQVFSPIVLIAAIVDFSRSDTYWLYFRFLSRLKALSPDISTHPMTVTTTTVGIGTLVGQR